MVRIRNYTIGVLNFLTLSDTDYVHCNVNNLFRHGHTDLIMKYKHHKEGPNDRDLPKNINRNRTYFHFTFIFNIA